ncbi:MAG TPA: HPr family phosphocarrier protein [Kiritimatiellia bacterium]|nr:HPr family phosphocarrier protein [Kiritimatiellia bacterium]HPS08661.1 HPr family phosphocarrier protein [Kiritimatiellia bacterium]
MKTQNVVVKCEHGLHLRVASQISNIARKSGVPVNILCEGCPKVDACSVFQLLTLGAAEGTALAIEVEDPDERKVDAVLQALTEVFDGGGGI